MIKRPKSHIPVGIIFHPSWWHEEYDICFGKDYCLDPEYRIDTRMKMDKLLFERFGDLGLGDPNPKPYPNIYFGLVTVPVLFRCEVIFHDDDDPTAKPADLPDEEIKKLQVPDVERNYPMNEIIKQIDYLEKKHGWVDVSGLNWQGPQNIGMKIRGERLLIDYLEKPEMAHKMLDLATKTILQLTSYLKKRTNQVITSNSITYLTNLKPNGLEHKLWVTANCTVETVSNQIYEKFLLPYENMLSENLQPYGIHHCGIIDYVLKGYAKVKNLKYLEVGWGSDVKKTRSYFPSLRINLRMGPRKLASASPEEIEEETRKLVENGKPLVTISVSCVNVGPGTPDENIRAIFHAVWKYGKLE